MNRLQAYRFKMKNLRVYLIAFIPLIIFMCILSMNKSNELRGAMLILNCIAISCTILHYRLNNQAYSFYYAMIYTADIFNFIAEWFFNSVGTSLILNYITSILGVLWLLLIRKEYDFIDEMILKHKILCSTIVVLIYTSVIYISKFKLNISNKEINFIRILIEINSIIGIFIIINLSAFSRVRSNIVSFLSHLIAILGLFTEFYFLSINNTRLEVAVENAKKVEQLKSNFFAVLTHELKTPVNIIFSCIQLLDTKKDSSADILQGNYKKYSVPLKQNCYRMLRLINNIVDMTKINAGHFYMRFTNCDIISLVENITLSIVPYVHKNNIEIIFDTIVEELEVKCDKDSVERIMLNVLSNSIKYTPDGGLIEVSIDVDTDFVYIRVKDNGCGIPKEKQEDVFDVFVQGDLSLARAKEGSGIGLSLVKSLITLHDGYVYIEESNEEGTTIVLQLPNKKLENEHVMNIAKGLEDNIINKIDVEFSDIYDIQ